MQHGKCMWLLVAAVSCSERSDLPNPRCLLRL